MDINLETTINLETPLWIWDHKLVKLVMNFATCCNRNESNWRFDIVDFDDSNIPQQKSTSSTKYCLVVHVSTISIPKQYFKNLIFHQNSYCGRFLTAMLSPKIRTHQISVIFFADVIIKFLLMLVNFILLLLIDFIHGCRHYLLQGIFWSSAGWNQLVVIK